MGGDEITGNLLSTEMMSSVRYFSKSNEHSMYAGGGFGQQDFDHRSDPVHGIEYIIPTKYIQNIQDYRLHFVVYALRLNPRSRGGGLSHSSSAPVLDASLTHNTASTTKSST